MPPRSISDGDSSTMDPSTTNLIIGLCLGVPLFIAILSISIIGSRLYLVSRKTRLNKQAGSISEQSGLTDKSLPSGSTSRKPSDQQSVWGVFPSDVQSVLSMPTGAETRRAPTAMSEHPQLWDMQSVSTYNPGADASGADVLPPVSPRHLPQQQPQQQEQTPLPPSPPPAVVRAPVSAKQRPSLSPIRPAAYQPSLSTILSPTYVPNTPTFAGGPSWIVVPTSKYHVPHTPT